MTDIEPTELYRILHEFGTTYRVLTKEERLQDINKAVKAINKTYISRSEHVKLLDKEKLIGRRIQAEVTLKKWQSFPEETDFTFWLDGQIKAHKQALKDIKQALELKDE